MTRYRVYILNWRLYHGCSMDVGEPKLAPGIWAVALNGPSLTDKLGNVSEPLYRTYDLNAVDLDDVFFILNMKHPADYRNRSLSVGDVVVDRDAAKAYICLSVGWAPFDCNPLPLHGMMNP